MVFNLYVKKRRGYLYMVLICDREVGVILDGSYLCERGGLP
jgi:hypothetical protein